ncbi:MAG: hypothetical protein ACYDIE_00760 [Candidatus Krumholzibacteriia bacterium]
MTKALRADQRPTSVLPQRKAVEKLEPAARLAYLDLFTAPLANPSRLTVWNGFEGDMAGYLDGPQFVDWHRESLAWKFIWTNGVAGAVAGRWQVIRWGTAGGPDDWLTPPGLVASGLLEPAPAVAGRRYVNIDFASFVPNPDGSPRNGLILDSLEAPKQLKARDTRRESKPKLQRAEVGGGKRAVATASPAPFVLKPATPLYHTFFVRVVPLDAQGQPVGPPTAPVMITFGEPSPPTPVHLPPGGQGHPTWRLGLYQPVRAFAPDCLCIYVVGQDIVNPLTHEVMLAAGTGYNVCETDDGGFFSDLADAFSGFVDALGSFVSWVANVYNSAKASLLSTVIGILQGTVGCGGACQSLVTAALDAGLAAVGLPPSLPDYDQLLAMGTDYLVCTIAANAGIPEEAARAGVDAMVDQARSSTQNGGGAIIFPDPMRQYRPLALVIELRNGSGSATQPVNLVVKEKSGKLYATDPVPVPSIPAGGSLRVPVFPRPVVDPAAWMGLLPTAQDAAASLTAYFDKQKQAVQALADWTRDYTTGAVTFTVATVDLAQGKTIDQGKVVCEAGSSRCVPTY